MQVPTSEHQYTSESPETLKVSLIRLLINEHLLLRIYIPGTNLGHTKCANSEYQASLLEKETLGANTHFQLLYLFRLFRLFRLVLQTVNKTEYASSYKCSQHSRKSWNTKSTTLYISDRGVGRCFSIGVFIPTFIWCHQWLVKSLEHP